MTSNTTITQQLESSLNRQRKHVPVDVKKVTLRYSTSRPSLVPQASSCSASEKPAFARTNSSLSTLLTSETPPHISIQQEGGCTPKAKTILSKKVRKRRRTPVVKPDVCDKAKDDEYVPHYPEESVKAIQLKLLKSLKENHTEEEKRKQAIENPFDNMAENEIETLAEKIYGGDKYNGEISERGLKDMRSVYVDMIKNNQKKKDRQSTIETMVL